MTVTKKPFLVWSIFIVLLLGFLFMIGYWITHPTQDFEEGTFPRQVRLAKAWCEFRDMEYIPLTPFSVTYECVDDQKEVHTYVFE